MCVFVRSLISNSKIESLKNYMMLGRLKKIVFSVQQLEGNLRFQLVDKVRYNNYINTQVWEIFSAHLSFTACSESRLSKVYLK